MAMQDSTALAFEQSFAKSHFVGLAQADRENQAMGNLAEQTRLGYLSGVRDSSLAQDILDQRSVEQQPQVSVVPAVPTAGSTATK
jgi:hypothetical protein